MPFIFSEEGHELILFRDTDEMIEHFESIAHDYHGNDKVVFENGTAGKVIHPPEGTRHWVTPEAEDLQRLVGQLKGSLTRTDMQLDKVASWQELFAELWRLENKDHRTGRCIAAAMWALIIAVVAVVVKLIL